MKRALELLGFRTVREANHISMIRENADGTRMLLTIPNHPRLKASTLRSTLAQAGIAREDFLRAYDQTDARFKASRVDNL